MKIFRVVVTAGEEFGWRGYLLPELWAGMGSEISGFAVETQGAGFLIFVYNFPVHFQNKNLGTRKCVFL